MLVLVFNSSAAIETSSNQPDCGLSFRAHNYGLDQRTSLHLTPCNDIKVKGDEFSVNFDLKLNDEEYTYGYVSKVIFNNQFSVDLLSYLLYSRFDIIYNDLHNNIINCERLESQQIFTPNEWININILFSRDTIILTAGDLTASIKHSIPKFRNIDIYFGSCQHTEFSSTDVAPMVIKNITINDKRGTPIYNWDMSTHLHEYSYDKINGSKAIINNGSWEIDKHVKWNKRCEFQISSNNPQVAFNNEGLVYFATDKVLYSYDIDNNSIDSVYFMGQPYIGSSSQMVYNSKSHELISYNLTAKKLNRYNFEQHRWQLNRGAEEVVDLQHHSRLVDTSENRLVTWGGYGNHKYDADIRITPLDYNNVWRQIPLDSLIAPRYLSAIGWADSANILILGGYGSLSGKQEESPKNFYDLFRININSGETVNLWTYKEVKSGEHFSFSNTMVVDPQNNSIYALIYDNFKTNTELSLAHFDIETNSPRMQIVSDTIKYNFHDIHSYCDISVYNNKLYAVTLYGNSKSASVQIYSINMPLVSDYNFSHVEPPKKRLCIGIIVASLSIICFTFTILIFITAKKKRKKETPLTDVDDSEFIPVRTESDRSQILLIGGFKVLDMHGNDITKAFTIKLKQLFLFILLDTINGNGTTSKILDDTFWFDMSKADATNNRSVSIRKLRLLLAKVGSVEIANRGGCWYIDIANDVFCDYKDVMHLIYQTKLNSREEVNKIIYFSTRGALLPNVTEAWIDSYKSKYSILLIESLLDYGDNVDNRSDSNLRLRIADAILNIDSIDENAIKMKCKALYDTGHTGISKSVYDVFNKEYFEILGSNPDFSWKDIIKG